MATSQDCATIGDMVASLICRGQYVSKYDLNSIPAYTALPSCAQSIISDDILSQAYCLARAVPGLDATTSLTYGPCICSTDFDYLTRAIGQAAQALCSPTPPPSSEVQGVIESWCKEAAGGFSLVTPTSVQAGDQTSLALPPSASTAQGISPYSLRTVTVTRSSIIATTSHSLTTASTALPMNPGSSSSSNFGKAAGLMAGASIAGAIGVLLMCIGLYHFLKAWKKDKKEEAEGATLGGESEKADKGKGKATNGEGGGGMLEKQAGQEENVTRNTEEAQKDPDIIEFYQPAR